MVHGLAQMVGLPAQSGAELRGHVGQDLHIVLVREGERKGERHFLDFAEGGVRMQPLGNRLAGAHQVGREQ